MKLTRRKAADLVDIFSSYQPDKEQVVSNYDSYEMARLSAKKLVEEMIDYLTVDGFKLEIEFWKGVLFEVELLKIKNNE